MFCANVRSQEENQLFSVQIKSEGLQKVKEKETVLVLLALKWTVCCTPVMEKSFHDIKIFVDATKWGDTIIPPN
jgi:hypothetical protein